MKTDKSKNFSVAKGLKNSGKFVEVFIGIILVAVLFPIAKQFITTASENGSATEVAMWGLVSLALIIAIVVYVLRETGVMKK